MTRKESLLLFLTLLGASACGKVQQVQDSFVSMASSNDLKIVELRTGNFHRSTGANGDDDWLEFENTQYRLGTLSSGASTSIDNMQAGQTITVLFKGNFVERSGVDVVDLTVLSVK